MEKKSSDNFSVNFCRAAPQPTARAKKLKLCVSVAARAMYCSATPAMQLVAVARAPCCQKGLGASRRVSTRLPCWLRTKKRKISYGFHSCCCCCFTQKLPFQTGYQKCPPPRLLLLSLSLLRRGIIRAPSGAAWLELGIK